MKTNPLEQIDVTNLTLAMSLNSCFVLNHLGLKFIFAKRHEHFLPNKGQEKALNCGDADTLNSAHVRTCSEVSIPMRRKISFSNFHLIHGT